MEYDIDYMQKVLSTISEVENGIIYTQHFEEKMNHRYVHDGLVEDRLCMCEPDEIVKIPGTVGRFELRYSIEGEGDLIVVVDIFNANQVILITAFFKKPGGVGNG